MELGAEAPSTLFYLAHGYWEQEMGLERLKPILQSLADGSPLSDAERKILKTARKTSDLMRQSFTLFDDANEAPVDLRKFASSFGDLNDLVANGKRKRASRKAKQVLDQIEKVEGVKYTDGYAPGEPGLYLGLVRDTVLAQLKASGKGPMPVEHFHDIRKEMKLFMNYFRLKYALHEDAKDLAIFEHLRRMNEEFGKINDAAIAEELKGEQKYESQTVQFPSGLRTDLYEFLNRLRIPNP